MNNIPQLISSKMLNDVGGGFFTVTITNPLPFTYVGLPPAGTTLQGQGGTGTDKVLSIQPGGDAQTRNKGTDGGYEKCKKQNGLLVFNPTGNNAFALPYAEI